jgi:uncharacterized membrane protein (DUF106 family)
MLRLAENLLYCHIRLQYTSFINYVIIFPLFIIFFENETHWNFPHNIYWYCNITLCRYEESIIMKKLLFYSPAAYFC